ncbi:hypothetical protein QCA50_017003 [Cerrena zonata]|uniref:Uncharacterized protein n=1 Tax=Cerrena zonata TaxID=2478898 RepID=A0AAW0FL63_9APHY
MALPTAPIAAPSVADADLPAAPTTTTPPADFGLSYSQKVFLEDYFERYLNAPSKADRRVIATTAAKELIRHDRITDKEDAART